MSTAPTTQPQSQFVTSLMFNDHHRDLIHDVSFDYHGRRLATSSSDMMVCVWNLSPKGTWTKASSWKSHGGPVWKVVWAHPEFGQILATCSFDRSVVIWEETGIRGRRKQTARSVGGLKVLAEEELLLSKPSETKVTKTGVHAEQAQGGTQWKRVCNLVDSRHNVTDIKFSPRHLGLMLATASSQGVVRIYEAPDIMNLSMWNLKDELFAFRHRCSALTWSTNRSLRPLIAVSSDELKISGDRVAVYEYHENLRKWQLLKTTPLENVGPVTDLAFAPSAGRSYHTLAIGSNNIGIYKFTKKAGGSKDPSAPTAYDIELVETLDSGSPSFIHVWRLSWNITGTILTVGSSDGNVRLWKSSFTKKWTLISTIKSTEDCKSRADDPKLTTSISSLTKQSQVYY